MKVGKIEKGIEAPPALNASPYDTLIAQLEIGDSFAVEDCAEYQRASFYRAAKKHGVFLISRQDREIPTNVRFWRVAEKPPRAKPGPKPKPAAPPALPDEPK